MTARTLAAVAGNFVERGLDGRLVYAPRSMTGVARTHLHAGNVYRGQVVLAGGTAAVVFATAELTTDYGVWLQGVGSGSEIFTVSNVAKTGFTITSSNGSSTATVNWLVDNF